MKNYQVPTDNGMLPFALISVDANGVALIAGTTTKVIEVALDRIAFDLSAGEIQAEHPHLSPAQVEAALSYYDGHREELDSEIARRYREAERLRASTAAPIPRDQLEKRRQAQR